VRTLFFLFLDPARECGLLSLARDRLFLCRSIILPSAFRLMLLRDSLRFSLVEGPFLSSYFSDSLYTAFFPNKYPPRIFLFRRFSVPSSFQRLRFRIYVFPSCGYHVYLSPRLTLPRRSFSKEASILPFSFKLGASFAQIPSWVSHRFAMLYVFSSMSPSQGFSLCNGKTFIPFLPLRTIPPPVPFRLSRFPRKPLFFFVKGPPPSPRMEWLSFLPLLFKMKVGSDSFPLPPTAFLVRSAPFSAARWVFLLGECTLSYHRIFFPGLLTFSGQ